jgi:hypothetical protein
MQNPLKNTALICALFKLFLRNFGKNTSLVNYGGMIVTHQKKTPPHQKSAITAPNLLKK